MQNYANRYFSAFKGHFPLILKYEILGVNLLRQVCNAGVIGWMDDFQVSKTGLCFSQEYILTNVQVISGKATIL